MANIITGCRIIISLILLFFPAFTPWFYALYLVGGLTDMADGFIARKTNTISKFGAKLDSIADLIFVTVCMIKILPSVNMTKWLWAWVAVIAIIKVVNILSGYVCQHRLVMLHTIANKVTGFLLFLLPWSFSIAAVKYVAVPVCIIATFAAIQEGHFIRTGRKCE